MLRLAIRDSSGERVFETGLAEVLVGSREGADLRLHDAKVAPNHCLLRLQGGRVRLIDLGTRDLRLAGGRRVDEALLVAGGEFAVGSTVVRILVCGGAPAPAAALPRLTLEEPAPPPPVPPPPPRRASAPHDGDFAREVRATVAKAPWYLLSLVVHVALLLFMDLVSYEQRPPTRVAHMASSPERERPEPEVPLDTPLDLTTVKPEVDLDLLEIDEPLSPAVRKDPATAQMSDYDDLVPPDRLGILGGRRPLKILDKPLPVSRVKGGDQALDKGDIKGEQGRATEEVKRNLGDGLRRAKQRLKAEHVVVVRGEFDKIEEVLREYEWPFTLVSREELMMHGGPQARLLFINCARKPSPAHSRRLGELVKKMLSRGCWVVTSDWAVEPYLTAAFPLLVQVAGKDRSQRDTTVVVEPVADDPLLAGVFTMRGESTWWLEDSSTMVNVSDRVSVLIASEEMRRNYGSRVVAFRFAHGKGVVVHLLGHFYQKDGNRRGLVAMHRLINNVILERVAADQ